ncbi:lipase family protein [Actinophytocola glycyrrhizae]|uniref:Lipase family protein n=1 Tax=Actinophytocola glycyrrhizae TaxID=2044873 RepID=A0ABV9S8J4_9PSEU
MVVALAAVLVPPAAAATARPWAGTLLDRDAVAVSPAVAAAGGQAYRLTYLSTSSRGAPRVVTGTLVVPPGPPPPGGFPVASWGHGTTGAADACAPSASPALGGYDTLVASLVDAGYAVVATDYEGLGTPGPHAYLVAESAGRGMIDAVRAGRQAQRGLSTTWVALGHSQGSQAVAATAEISGTYGRGLRLAGAVAFAAPINLAGTIAQRLRDVEGDFGAQALYPLILSGLRTEHPQLRYSDYLGPRAAEVLPLVETACLADIYGWFAARDLPASEFQPVTQQAMTRLEDWLAGQGIPRQRTAAPFTILIGDQDEIVGVDEASAVVAGMCHLGSAASLRVYPGLDHNAVVPAATGDAMTWLADRLAGRPVTTDC